LNLKLQIDTHSQYRCIALSEEFLNSGVRLCARGLLYGLHETNARYEIFGPSETDVIEWQVEICQGDEAMVNVQLKHDDLSHLTHITSLSGFVLNNHVNATDFKCHLAQTAFLRNAFALHAQTAWMICFQCTCVILVVHSVALGGLWHQFELHISLQPNKKSPFRN
jgi:hypothetical protein